jgi:hypothetical protein
MAKNDVLSGTEDLAEKMKKIKEQLSGEKNLPKMQPKENSNISPKLFVSGRLDRKSHNYSARSLTLLGRLEDEIKSYCRGGEIAVLNYLIREGLRKVKDSTNTINIDMSEIEGDDI